MFSALKKYLFGTWDRAYTFLSAVLSIVSIGLTAFLWKFPQKIPELIVTRDIFVFFSLIFICGVLLGKYIRREHLLKSNIDQLQDANSRLSEQFKIFHKQTHKYRDDTFEYFQRFAPISNIATPGQKAIFEKLCHSITTDIRNVLNEYILAKGIIISESISVTIKLTLESDTILKLCGERLKGEHKAKIKENDKWVITAFRDPETWEKLRYEREVRTTIYTITGNTAFNSIINGQQRCFFCNDLSGLSEYKNENPNWAKQYNSTIVCPIRFRDNEKRKWETLGLIAADCLNEKKHVLFDDQECRCILGHAADMLATYFLLLSLNNQSL